jgi:hypothetical protein
MLCALKPEVGGGWGGGEGEHSNSGCVGCVGDHSTSKPQQSTNQHRLSVQTAQLQRQNSAVPQFVQVSNLQMGQCEPHTAMLADCHPRCKWLSTTRLDHDRRMNLP